MMGVLLFALWSFLWAGYFALDGFDFGVGALFPILGRNDAERRLMINSIGPVWSGNEVWLITAGGVTFAAFPAAYAGILSSFFSLFGITIAALILRGVIFEFRNRGRSAAWRRGWDAAFAAGSIVAAFLFGVIFGNIFEGLPMGGSGYAGPLASFFNPYGLITGVLFLVLFAHHGALWLSLRTGGGMKQKASSAAGFTWYLLAAAAAAFAVATAFSTRLYDNYINHPGWFIVPAILIAALFYNKYLLLVKKDFAAFLTSGLAVTMTVFFAVVGLFPNLLPSSAGSRYSITISGAAASTYALVLAAVALFIFMPLIIGYQLWVYGVFRNRLRERDVAADEDAY